MLSISGEGGGYSFHGAATHLENLEKLGHVKVIREELGKMCSQLWCFTVCITLHYIASK